MFETYTQVGVEKIVVMDWVKGFVQFLVVAFGGTIIGKKNIKLKSKHKLKHKFFHRCNLGILYWFGDTLYRSCASHRAYFHFRYGIFSIFEC